MCLREGTVEWLNLLGLEGITTAKPGDRDISFLRPLDLAGVADGFRKAGFEIIGVDGWIVLFDEVEAGALEEAAFVGVCKITLEPRNFRGRECLFFDSRDLSGCLRRD